MKINNKTLLQTMIVEEKELVQKTKEFLKNLTQPSGPLGIVLKQTDPAANYALAYERERFVVVVPNGQHAAAKAYGNWDEALICAQKMLASQCESLHNNQILLAQYDKNQLS